MQAYFKMRGSTMGGYEDPLFDWIREREDLPSTNPPADKKKRVSRYVMHNYKIYPIKFSIDEKFIC